MGGSIGNRVVQRRGDAGQEFLRADHPTRLFTLAALIGRRVPVAEQGELLLGLVH